MITTITEKKYTLNPFIYPPKAIVDNNNIIVEYIVDAYRDRKFNDTYTREYLRFKISTNNIEVYYGNCNNTLLWEKYDIYSVKNIYLSPDFAKEQVKEWFKEKIAEEENL